MDKSEIFKDFEVEASIENLIQKISQKIEEYKSKKDEKTKKELAQLIEDRNKIYNLDEETIKKYIKS